MICQECAKPCEPDHAVCEACYRAKGFYKIKEHGDGKPPWDAGRRYHRFGGPADARGEPVAVPQAPQTQLEKLVLPVESTGVVARLPETPWTTLMHRAEASESPHLVEGRRLVAALRALCDDFDRKFPPGKGSP